MTSGFNLGNAFGRVVISDNVDEAMRQAQGSFDRGLRGLGSSMQRFGDQLTGVGARITALTAPITAFGVTGIRVASDFDSTMAEISARAGLVGEDLEKISDTAIQLGADTMFSAQQAADAFLQLLAAGQSTEEALATLPLVLQAATAGGIDLATASDGLTNILSIFKLQAEDSASVVDSLARASGASKAEMLDLQQAFATGGPPAAAFGLSVDETAAALAIFSQNGIQGVEAGTQLKSMLTNMTRNTETVATAWATLGVETKNADGSFRDLNDIMVDVNDVINSGRLTESELWTAINDIAGSYGALGFRALTAGTSIEDMQAAMQEETSAAEMAARRMDTFAGAVDSLKGSIETLQIRVLTPFMNDVLKPLAERLTEIINQVTAWAEANPELAFNIVKVLTVVTALGPVLVGLGIAISTIGIAIGALASPIWLVIGAVGALGAAWINNFMGIRDVVNAVVPRIRDALGEITEAFQFVFLGGGPSGAMLSTPMLRFFLQIRETIESFIQTVKPLLQELGTFFSRMFAKIDFGKMLEVGQTLLAMTNPIGQVSLVLKAMGVNFGAILGSVIDALTTFFATLNEGGDVFDGLEAVFGDSTIWQTLRSGLHSVADFVQGTVMPALQRLGAWFIEEALPAVITFVETTAIPAIQQFFEFLGTVWQTVGPALQQLGSWFIDTALPTVVGFIQSTVIPAIQGFIGGLANVWAVVGPALQQLGNWFISDVMPQVSTILGKFIGLLGSIWEVVGPALGDLARWFLEDGLPLIQQFITDVALPLINGWIEVLETIWAVVGPPLRELLNWFISVGLPQATAFLSEIVMPAINLLIDTLTGIWNAVEGPLGLLSEGLASIFGWIVDNVLTPVSDAIVDIMESIGEVIDFVDNLNQTGKGKGGLFGSGLGPDFDPIGGIRGDGGGSSDVAQMVQNIGDSRAMSPATSPAESGLSQGGGDQYYIQVDVPLDVLRNEPGLQANADTLAQSFRERMRRGG